MATGPIGGLRQRHCRRHAERDRVVGIFDGEARRIGAGRRIRLRREFAQTRREAAVRVRPTAAPWLGLAGFAEPGLGQRDDASISP